MPVKRGVTNNPSGRPTGKLNHTTTEMRQFIMEFLNKDRKQMMLDWLSIPPAERMYYREKFTALVLPRNVNIGVESLPDAQLDAIINQLVIANNERLQSSENQSTEDSLIELDSEEGDHDRESEDNDHDIFDEP